MVENATMSGRELTHLPASWSSAFAVIGVCSYIGGFALPFAYRWDWPLIALAVIGVLAALFDLSKGSILRLPLSLPVLLFLIATALSISTSANLSRSLRLSMPLLPAVLLFLLIGAYFDGIRSLRTLYFTLSVVGLGLAVLLLRVAWTSAWSDPESWAAAVGSPILVVKNDVTFLAVLAPLSVALAYRKFRSIVGVTAVFSILLTVAVVGFFQSRVAMLTLVASIACTAGVLRPRLGLFLGLASVGLVLLVDALLGFPLVTKFVLRWDGSGRIPLWLAAAAMFLDAPILGHGPHTFVLFYRSYLQNFNLPAWLFTESRVVPWAHNLYLEVLAEQGIVGLAALGFLLARGLSAAWRISNTADGEARILAAGAVGGLVGLCVAGMIELSLLRLWVVVTLFVLMGVIAKLFAAQASRGNCTGHLNR